LFKRLSKALKQLLKLKNNKINEILLKNKLRFDSQKLRLKKKFWLKMNDKKELKKSLKMN
jgi:hypothetical protein